MEDEQNQHQSKLLTFFMHLFTSIFGHISFVMVPRGGKHLTDFVNSCSLVHKHVKFSVNEWILETTRPHKHVIIFGIFLCQFYVQIKRKKLEAKYYFL